MRWFFCFKDLFFSWDPLKGGGGNWCQRLSPAEGASQAKMISPSPSQTEGPFKTRPCPASLSCRGFYLFAYLLSLPHSDLSSLTQQSSFLSNTLKNGNSKKWLVWAPLIIVWKRSFKNIWATSLPYTAPPKTLLKWRGKALVFKVLVWSSLKLQRHLLQVRMREFTSTSWTHSYST